MSDVISLAPIAQTLEPFAVSLAATLVTGFVGWWATTYRRWTGKQMAQADQDTLSSAINTAAGSIFASAEAGISSASIHVSDPRIASAVATVSTYLPMVIRMTGVTPDELARRIHGRLGELQAQAPAPVMPEALPAKAA